MSNDQSSRKNSETVIIDAGDTDDRSEDEDIAKFLNDYTVAQHSITNSLLTNVLKINEAIKLGDEEGKDDDVIEVIRVNPSIFTEYKPKSLKEMSGRRDFNRRCAKNVPEKKIKLCEEVADEMRSFDVEIEGGLGKRSEYERVRDREKRVKRKLEPICNDNGAHGSMNQTLTADRVIELHSSEDESANSSPKSTFRSENANDSIKTTMKDFKAYFEYLRKCVTKINFDQEMQRRTSLNERFHVAVKSIETEIDRYRQMFLRYTRKHHWSEKVMACIQSNTLREVKERSQKFDDGYCENCATQKRFAKYMLIFSGYRLDACRLYEFGWTHRILQASTCENYQHEEVLVDDTCYAPVVLYWTLVHVKRLWCATIDAMKDEGGQLKLSDTFMESEYSRYKELLKSVLFVSSGRDLQSLNLEKVCKYFSQSECTSPYLLHAEVDSDSDSDMEENIHGVQDSAPTFEDGGEATLRSDTDSIKKSQGPQAPLDLSNGASSMDDTDKVTQEVKGTNSCLLCYNHLIDGAVIHGNYLHSYSCYQCGMRQFDQRIGCSVCNRPIDRVVHLLPLTEASRRSITTLAEPI